MDKYEVIHRIGKGGCGMVYLVRQKENRRLYALKTVELDERKKTRTKEAVLKEARILSRLKHPHIVMYHESFFDGDMENLNIIQDYCDGGTLDDKIKQAAQKKQGKYFQEKQVMEKDYLDGSLWGIQIIMAVQYMHTQKVLHRDLKAENVFLTKKNIIKIGDFGISKVLENTIDVAKTVVGTPSYLSPELCQDIPYSSKSDIWAVGCLLYEMCALKPPFDAQSLISLFFKIIKGEFEPIPSNYSPELHDLISSILVTTPDDRPSASAILNTNLVKEHLAQFIEEKENLLQQRYSKEDSVEPISPHTDSTVNLSNTCDKIKEGSQMALKRNKVKIASSSPLTKPGSAISVEKAKPELRSPHKNDSGLGVSSETAIIKDGKLEVPQADGEVLSDYSDDFDDSSSHSDEEEDIQEVIEGEVEEEGVESDIEDQSEMENNADRGEVADRTDTTDGAEYMDDFEEYDSSEDLDLMVNQAREAQDIEAVDDWFAESMSEHQVRQTFVLKQQCEIVLGGRKLREVGKLVTDGTLTEQDLRPTIELRRSMGNDDVEICHLNVEDLDSG